VSRHAADERQRGALVGSESSVRLPLPEVEPGDEKQQEATGAGALGANRQPWSDSRFWILQLIVLALYLVRLAATLGFHLDVTSLGVEFSTFPLFLVPLVFAALQYGLPGASFTSAWVTLLAVPRFSVALSSHDYGAAWSELIQIVLLDAVTLLVGQRITSERNARTVSESVREAHRNAEALYRDLFDSNQAPILIVDLKGIVLEANASAQRVFASAGAVADAASASSRRAEPPMRLVDMIGPEAASQVLTLLICAQTPLAGAHLHSGDSDELVEPVTFYLEEQPVLFRPTATKLGPFAHDERMQVVFEDVTTETLRRDLMEAYAARVVLGQEEERRSIAQELHDGPLQSLIHLCRQIDAVKTDPAGANDRGPSLSELRITVESTVSELRAIAKGLRPSVLDDLGLVASIKQMLTEAGGREQFETSFGITGAERRLSPTVELALFRITQEALSNIERHAAAERVAIGMNFETGGLRLLIKDDGVGFDASDRASGIGGQSLGLPGMTERARLIGSRLHIHSDVAAGTTVDVWVPATILDRK